MQALWQRREQPSDGGSMKKVENMILLFQISIILLILNKLLPKLKTKGKDGKGIITHS